MSKKRTKIMMLIYRGGLPVNAICPANIVIIIPPRGRNHQ